MTHYELPQGKPEKSERIAQVMYRIPDRETQDALTLALERSNLSAQQLVDHMVKHCLREAGLLKEKS